MEDLRFISKQFTCDNCHARFKKLVHASESNARCEKCGVLSANVTEENEFNREQADRTYRMTFIDNNQRVGRNTRPADASQANQTRNGNQQRNERGGTRQRLLRNMFIPFSISPFAGSVSRFPFDMNIFDDPFSDQYFDMPGNDFFMDNFSSNFTSNFYDPLTRIVFMQSMQNQPSGTPPASKKAMEKLKRFKMTEDHCKKDPEKETLEYPTCSVCLTEITKDEDTILVPCGHMFHDPCITKWLELHNSCPVCRFELPSEDPDYERQRQGRAGNRAQARANGV